MSVPESCPKIALRCETGMIGMKWRIWEAKLMLLKRIKMQNMDTLSRQVYEESKKKGWPGLGEEVTKICNNISIPDLNSNVVSKEEIKDAIWNHHYLDIKEELSKSKKLCDIKDEDFTKVQSYFDGKSVESTRMAFQVRSHMVPEIPGNFKNKYKNKEGGWLVHIARRKLKWTRATALNVKHGRN